MTRQELEAKAYELIKSDMSYINTLDEEIWSDINKATDEDLESYINEWEDEE